MKINLTQAQFDLITWCCHALKEQHIKIMLEGEEYKQDWVTEKSDEALRILFSQKKDYEKRNEDVANWNDTKGSCRTKKPHSK